MTTIAFRDGVMAADTQAVNGWTRVAAVTKVNLSKSGRLIAASGSGAYAEKLRKWAEGEEGDPPLAPEKSTGIIVDADGSVITIEDHGQCPFGHVPFAAWGSGREYALGAMAMGATAEEAVAAAIRFDIGSGGEITTVRLGGSK